MRGRKYFTKLVVIVGLMMVAATSFADMPSATLNYTETDLGGGLWQYDYTFTNTSDPGSTLYKIFLDLDHVANVTGSALPTGWAGTVWEGNHDTSFLEAMSLSPASDVNPGSSLSGFSFEIDYQAGALPFIAEFDNGAGAGRSVWAGTTTVVPEPLSMILFAAGGGTMALRYRMRRKK